MLKDGRFIEILKEAWRYVPRTGGRALILTNRIDVAREAVRFLRETPYFKKRAAEAGAPVVWAVTGAAGVESDIEVTRDMLVTERLQNMDILIGARDTLGRAINLVDDAGLSLYQTIILLECPHQIPEDPSLALARHKRRSHAFMTQCPARGDEFYVQCVLAANAERRNLTREVRNYYRSTADADLRNDEVMGLAVDIAQIIGRGVRGGEPSIVVLLDAAFFAGITNHDRPCRDDERTSPMICMKRNLDVMHAQGPQPVVDECYLPLMAALTYLLEQDYPAFVKSVVASV
jgi:hypothetical protein